MSVAQRPARVEKHRIQRRRGADEQSVELGTAEAHVGDRFRNQELAEERAIACMAVHTVAGGQP